MNTLGGVVVAKNPYAFGSFMLALPKHLLSLTLLLIIGGLVAALPTLFGNDQAKAEVIGTYKDWTAGTYRSNGNLVCNMWSQPSLSIGKYKRRGEVYLFVTHFPADKVMRQISLDMGYPIGIESVTITVRNQNYSFQTEGNHAYAREEDIKRLIKDFQKGATMLAKSRSTRGTDTKDTFSLRGFSKAYSKINKNCAN